MNNNCYDFNEKKSEIKDSLFLTDDLKDQIDKKKSLQNEYWAAIREKLRIDWIYEIINNNHLSLRDL